MRIIKESLNVSELNDLLEGKRLEVSRGFLLQESFSITDINADGETKVVGIPGVTLVFDLEGSSLSIRQNGPRAFIDRFASMFSELTSIIYQYHGIVEKFPGDGISAHFLKKNGETSLNEAQERSLHASHAIKDFMRTQMRNSNFRLCLWTGEDTVATFVGNHQHHKEMISIGHGVNMAHKIEKHVKANECLLGMDLSLALKNSRLGYGEYISYLLPADLRSPHENHWYGVKL